MLHRTWSNQHGLDGTYNSVNRLVMRLRHEEPEQAIACPAGTTHLILTFRQLWLLEIGRTLAQFLEL